MELFLNLAWLLLALPAFLLWRERSTAAGRFTSLQCLLALGCVLVILFPVVSATDDLRAMRAEMEESPIGKHTCCHKSSEKISANKGHSQPALTASPLFCTTNYVAPYSLATFSIMLAPAPVSTPTGRAPPSSLLG
jgi:hypothetical protein